MAGSVDTKQLRWHSYELATTAVAAPTAVEAVTKLATRRIQGHARTTLAGSRHFWKLARDLSSEVDRNQTQVKGVVGYERGLGKGHQSGVAHLAEYGSSKTGPLRPHLGPALDANQEPYERALLAALTAPLAKGIGPMGGIKR